MNPRAVQAMKKAHEIWCEQNKHLLPGREFERIKSDVTKKFWNEQNEILLEKQKGYSADAGITADHAVLTLRKEIRRFAKERELECAFVSRAKQYCLTILPFPIHIVINIETGGFFISAPGVKTKTFVHNEWQMGMAWIKDYLDIDKKILEDRIRALKDEILVSSKTAEIARNSISALCNARALELGMTCSVDSTWLKSKVTFFKDKVKQFEFEIYFKEFSKNPGLLQEKILERGL